MFWVSPSPVGASCQNPALGYYIQWRDKVVTIMSRKPRLRKEQYFWWPQEEKELSCSEDRDGESINVESNIIVS